MFVIELSFRLDDTSGTMLEPISDPAHGKTPNLTAKPQIIYPRHPTETTNANQPQIHEKTKFDVLSTVFPKIATHPSAKTTDKFC